MPREDRPFEQDCSVCRTDESKRTEWGCDERSEQPVVRMSGCPFCDGGVQTCAHCHGTDELRFYRCPFGLVKPEHLRAVDLVLLAESGHLPDEGGVLDQAATWLQAMPIIQAEIAGYRDAARKKAIADAQQRGR